MRLTADSPESESLNLGTVWLNANERTASTTTNFKNLSVQHYLTTLVPQVHLCYLVNYYQIIVYLYLKMLSVFVS